MPSNLTTPPCQKYACAIQDCLAKNNYQESKCKEALDNLKKCCIELVINQGGKSSCCPENKYKTPLK